MSEYYDKQSFGGGKKPPEKKEDGEINWVVVVILFAIGLWPIALLYMGWRWLQGNGKESADEKLRRVQKKFDDAIDGALKGFAGGETANRDEAKKASAAESAAAAKTAGKTTSRKRTGKKEKALKKISTLGAMGVFWQLLGAFFLLGAVGCLGEVGGDLAYLQTLKYCVEELIVGLNMLAAGGVMLCHGISTNRFAKRAKKYLAAVGNAEAMDIDLIARRLGCGKSASPFTRHLRVHRIGIALILTGVVPFVELRLKPHVSKLGKALFKVCRGVHRSFGREIAMPGEKVQRCR